MNIHFSSATIQSYENKEKSMDLFYSPIVIFENVDPSIVEQLEDVKFTVQAKQLGTVDFDIQSIVNVPMQACDNKVFLEFKLYKKDVAFHYDNYACQITLSVMSGNKKIEHNVVGIVKTKYSKGLI